ncbi:MAG: HAMP domain-containing histidine kinase [Alcaligenaceae bacterium]|nr:MAG: HAMP domain-containing histidine kinase [Alcaligenaceae bacterium]
MSEVLSKGSMRIARFLEVARQPILEAAVAFAKSLPPLASLDERALRDHLPNVLEAISADLRSEQSRNESIVKSLGDAVEASSHTAAQTHGLMRAKDGISIAQLVAEFRALRSSVLRLWGEAHAPGPHAIADITRFNEAIDQAVAESVQFYADERERWQHIFLGIVGHDLRAPVNTIAMTAELIRLGGAVPPAHTALLVRGVARVSALLDSMLEYNRSSLGVGMNLHASDVDLKHVCEEEVEMLRAGMSGAHIAFHACGDTCGLFDASRVREALANLVTNAVRHGGATEPTVVTVEANEDVVLVSVENEGEIGEHEFEHLFEPLRRRDTPSSE